MDRKDKDRESLELFKRKIRAYYGKPLDQEPQLTEKQKREKELFIKMGTEKAEAYRKRKEPQEK